MLTRKLTGCVVFPLLVATGCSTPSALEPSNIDTCPINTEYSDQTQAELIDELTATADSDTIERFLADYKNLRDQVRACRV